MMLTKLNHIFCRGKKQCKLFGKWVEYLYAMDPEQFDQARSSEKQERRHSRTVQSSPKQEKVGLLYHACIVHIANMLFLCRKQQKMSS